MGMMTLNAQRIEKRRLKLNEVAQKLGYDSWTKFETGVINGRVVFMQIARAEVEPKRRRRKKDAEELEASFFEEKG